MTNPFVKVNGPNSLRNSTSQILRAENTASTNTPGQSIEKHGRQDDWNGKRLPDWLSDDLFAAGLRFIPQNKGSISTVPNNLNTEKA